MTTLYIRTEASAQVGMGHFMRCFAIAEAARDRDIAVTFWLTEISEAVTTRCAEMGADVRTVPPFGTATDTLCRDLRDDDWLLIDSYRATADDIAAFRAVTRVAVIDDLDVLERFDCDLLINAALAAPRESYARKTTARLLLGADYALIRKEFTQAQTALAHAPAVTLMFGGSDPAGLSGRVAESLHDALPGHLIQVIAGPANTRLIELQGLAARLPRLRLFVAPPSVARVLLTSDLVITAAGGSVGEIATLGLPALVLVAYDNQKAALDACPYPVIDVRSGVPRDLSAQVADMLADPDALHRNARAAKGVVDGAGAQRVVEAMFDA